MENEVEITSEAIATSAENSEILYVIKKNFEEKIHFFYKVIFFHLEQNSTYFYFYFLK